MSPEERMTIYEQSKYLNKMRIRYCQATERKERSRLLDEMEAVTELHRKSLLRLIKGVLVRKPSRKQLGKTYGTGVKASLQVIAKSLDYPCAERLWPNLVWLVKHLERNGELKPTSQVEEQLNRISLSALRRILGPSHQATDRLAHAKSRPGTANALLLTVPMRRITLGETQVGHFEVEMLHHNGGKSTDQFIYILQLVDVVSGWSEYMPILGNSFRVMQDCFEAILNRLSFGVLELHPDNGSDFFNSFLLKYWKDKLRGLELSRNRPLHKNDNRFV